MGLWVLLGERQHFRNGQHLESMKAREHQFVRGPLTGNGCEQDQGHRARRPIFLRLIYLSKRLLVTMVLGLTITSAPMAVNDLTARMPGNTVARDTQLSNVSFANDNIQSRLVANRIYLP
jgi:hypothetical protein